MWSSDGISVYGKAFLPDSLPVEKISGICFPAGCDVLMSGYCGNGVAAAECFQQCFERTILCFGKRFEIAAFHFDADRKSVAFFPTAE